MCHTSLPMHHVSWPRVAFASPTPEPHGGGRRPLGGAPGTPAAAPPDWRVVGPAGARYEPPPPSIRLPRPPDPPRVPHPGWGGAARACGTSPRRPLMHYTGSAGRQESGGAPHCPERPPPRQLALKANRRLAGCCAGGARRPGASYPPPTGVCTHGTGHRHPLGGSHTTTHPQHHGHGRKGIPPGNGLPQAEGRCRPPGSSWPPPVSSSLSSPLAVPAHSPRGG